MPTVSIIVPCFNQEKFISKSLKSVMYQSYNDWECIIIDDGSTDNSKREIDKISLLDNRFKYIYQNNSGVVAARNNAIKKSTGKYILCLDADDFISNKYVELCVCELERDDDIKLVTCNYKYFGKSKKTMILEPFSLERLLGHNLFINCSMFRKKDFEKSGGFNPNMNLGYEDWDFWISILKYGGKVTYLKGIHFFYRIKSKNSSRNQIADQNFNQLRKLIWENHKEIYSKVYPNPLYSAEYFYIINSREYRFGKILLYPFRLIHNLFMSI